MSVSIVWEAIVYLDSRGLYHPKLISHGISHSLEARQRNRATASHKSKLSAANEDAGFICPQSHYDPFFCFIFIVCVQDLTFVFWMLLFCSLLPHICIPKASLFLQPKINYTLMSPHFCPLPHPNAHYHFYCWQHTSDPLFVS